MVELQPFTSPDAGLKQIIAELPNIYPLDKPLLPDEGNPQKKIKQLLFDQYEELKIYHESPTQENYDIVSETLVEMIDNIQLFDLTAADRIVNLLIQWDYQSPSSWYEKAKILFQLFLDHQYHDLDEIIGLFKKVIEMGKGDKEFKKLPYWSYVFLGNIYLYRILEGEQALEQALKFYNEGYRYAKTHDVEIDENLIFDNVEIMQKILMNQFPLLLVIYNDTGQLLFEFLFQFIEVMNQDKRFIPNFTALLSAVDDHIESLFKSHITNSYLVMKNRLLVVSTLHEGEKGEWIKVAMVFSYLQQSAFKIDIDQIIMEKINEFVSEVNARDDIMDRLTQFNGRRYDDTMEQIEQILQNVFSAISDDDM